MKAAIENIIIKERIRKEVNKISELAEDIKRNGLINPVTVMSISAGQYQLIAGLRRIKAVQYMGQTDIDVNVVTPTDAGTILGIEISENEQREPFTYSEQLYYGKLIEVIEKAKADERKAEGQSLGGSIAGKGRHKDDSFENHGSQSYQVKKERNAQTRDIVGAQIGMSGMQYERAKYVSENASPEIIEQLDKGERTVSGVYKEIKAKEKASEQPTADSAEAEDSDDDAEDAPPNEGATKGLVLRPIPQPKTPLTRKHEPALPSASMTEEEIMSHFSERDRENLRRIKEFKALPPEGKIKDLQKQLFDMTVRMVAAESERDRLKYEYGIKVDHKDSIIDSLKRQVARLDEMLEAADKRIAELEGKKPTDTVRDAAII